MSEFLSLWPLCRLRPLFTLCFDMKYFYCWVSSINLCTFSGEAQAVLAKAEAKAEAIRMLSVALTEQASRDFTVDDLDVVKTHFNNYLFWASNRMEMQQLPSVWLNSTCLLSPNWPKNPTPSSCPLTPETSAAWSHR